MCLEGDWRGIRSGHCLGQWNLRCQIPHFSFRRRRNCVCTQPRTSKHAHIARSRVKRARCALTFGSVLEELPVRARDRDIFSVGLTQTLQTTNRTVVRRWLSRSRFNAAMVLADSLLLSVDNEKMLGQSVGCVMRRAQKKRGQRVLYERANSDFCLRSRSKYSARNLCVDDILLQESKEFVFVTLTWSAVIHLTRTYLSISASFLRSCVRNCPSISCHV